MPTLPKFPLPIYSEPAPLWILDTIQGHEEAGYAFLKSLGLTDLADFHGIMTDEQTDRIARIRRRLSAKYQEAVGSAAMDYQPYSVWLRHREVYEPHPVMSRELVTMRADSAVPGDVFQRLRHPNPMFLLSGAPSTRHPDGKPGRILALMFTGAISNAYPTVSGTFSEDAPGNGSILVDTTDPLANAYRVTVVSEVHNQEGTRVVDLDWCHLTIPIRAAFTLDELVTHTALGGFRWAEDSIKELYSQESQRNYLLTAARVAVSHLLYACSRTVEVGDKPRASRPPVVRRPGQPRPPKAARMRRLGWRLGAAIENSVRAAAAGRDGVAVPTGRRVAPHIRGAHLHLYRVGPGRQEVDLKWLDPIPVNASRDDGVTVTRHRVL